MMQSARQRCGLVLAALCCAGGWTCALGAEDGELFPNVASYDETVATPIRQPERSIDLTPAGIPGPPRGPGVNPRPTVPRRPAPSSAPPDAATPDTAVFAPYADSLLSPMLSPEDRKTFNAQYAEIISKALAGTTDQRSRTADLIEAGAQEAASPDLKRYLMLHAFGLYIRAAMPAAQRVEKAQKLLPLLTDRSLPVVQARADALNDLLLTSTANPSERFVDWYIDAYATLAKLQVQAGFPRDAQDSIKKAREGSLHMPHKSPARVDEVNEAAAWCDRAAMAAGLWPHFQETLKTAPNDPFTNNMMATLHLSLYGNLEHAAPFAAKSDRKDLRALAEAIKANPPAQLSGDPARRAAQALAIARALVDVARATSAAQAFDRYSIACYAGDRIAGMLVAGGIPAEKSSEAAALLTAAREIIEKTGLRRGDDLPRWLESGGLADARKTAPRSFGNLGDILRAIPRDLVPGDAGWTKKQVDDINAWLADNVAGQTFQGNALFDHVDRSVDGSDGKGYVPVIFGLPYGEIRSDVGVRGVIENRMTAAQAADARRLVYQKTAGIKGTITSAALVAAEGVRTARLNLVLASKAE